MANRTVSVALRADIGQYVAGMSQAAAATKGLGETADVTGKKAKGGFDIAGKGGLLMGGAVVAGLGMAISKSMEFEKAMSGIQAATHASAGTMSDLRDAAMKAGADTAYSATEAADAITEMSKAGVSAKDIMGGGLKGALSLAAAGQLDVADAAGIASVAMQQFGLSGKDLPHVADLLAAGAGKAMGSVDDLGQALNQSGLIASAAGISIEETTGTLSAFANAGLIGSDAGTSFKTMLQALQAPSEKSAGVMADLGINVYDAQGHMKSMQGVAGELSTHLNGLTDEQRNSALATIFGSDAVRAANVLYKEGATGIAEWTGKVNDAGYAADTAAALQDNLSGDLEKLGGSFDTLMISLGSGSQGPLRELVQDFTSIVNGGAKLVDLFSKIPGPVIAAAAAVGGFALLKGPVSSAFETIGLKAMYAAESLTGGKGLKGAMSGLAGAINPAMLGIAAATVLISSISSTMRKASEDEDKWAQAILDGSSSLARFNAEAKAQDDKEPFAWMAKLDHWTGATSSMDDARKKARELYDAMTPLEQANQDVTRETNQLAEAIDKYGKNSPQAAKAADEVAAANDRLAQRSGEVKTATDQAAFAQLAAKDPAAALQETLQGVSDAAGNSKKQIDLYKTSLDILNGAELTAIEAEADFYAAIGASDGALKGMTGSVLNASGGLDLQSEAGRKTFDVLNGVRDAADQYIGTLIAQGATSAEANAKDAELRRSFYETALQMTGSREAAEQLTNKIYGIPEQRTTTITADTKPAQDALTDLLRKYDGKVINMATAYTEFGPSYGHDVNVGYKAAGGPIVGPGGPTDDKAGLYRLSNGEHVWTAREVSAAGGHAGVKAMRSQVLGGKATGGGIGINLPVNVNTAALSAGLQGTAQALSAAATVGGGVDRWRGLVDQVLGMLGQSLSMEGAVLRRIKFESGGNPNAVNLTDSNAIAGHPSRGLMQTIPSTFAAYAGPFVGRGINDPLASIYAGANYALHRYGSLSAIDPLVRPMGYANGGSTPAGEPFWVGERGPELMWSSREQFVSTAAQSREFSGSSGGRASGATVVVPAPQVVNHFYIDGQELRGMTRTEIDRKLGELADANHYATGA